MTRAERVLLLGLGLCFGLLEPVVYLLAALNGVSAAQRVHRALRELSVKP